MRAMNKLYTSKFDKSFEDFGIYYKDMETYFDG